MKDLEKRKVKLVNKLAILKLGNNRELENKLLLEYARESLRENLSKI